MRGAALDHGREEDLRKHGAQLAHARAEPVARAAHSRREDFRGSDEGRGVGAEVEEELCEHVEHEEMCFGQTAPREAQDAEDDRQDGKAADLNRLAPDLVDGEDGEPVSGQRAGADEDDLASGRIAQVLVEVVALVEAHSGEERGGGEA